MHPACLFGKHRWQPLQRTGALELSPERCRRCGRTRIWNPRDEQWMHGPAEGLPEEAVAFLAGAGKLDEAPMDTDLPVSRQLIYTSGGGGLVVGGAVVAAMSLPLWLATPDPSPKLALGLPLLALGYLLAAGRREVRVQPEERTLIRRFQVLPFTVLRRAYPVDRFQRIRVAREPGALVLGPRWGPQPNFLVRALGPDADVMVQNCYDSKTARGIARNLSRALDLPVDDKTREPGAPGT